MSKVKQIMLHDTQTGTDHIRILPPDTSMEIIDDIISHIVSECDDVYITEQNEDKIALNINCGVEKFGDIIAYMGKHLEFEYNSENWPDNQTKSYVSLGGLTREEQGELMMKAIFFHGIEEDEEDIEV